MVGLVIVSHSAALAEGVVALAREMGGEEVAIEAAGGMEDGAIGTDAERVRAAIDRARSDDGVLVLMDLGVEPAERGHEPRRRPRVKAETVLDAEPQLVPWAVGR